MSNEEQQRYLDNITVKAETLSKHYRIFETSTQKKSLLNTAEVLC